MESFFFLPTLLIETLMKLRKNSYLLFLGLVVSK